MWLCVLNSDPLHVGLRSSASGGLRSSSSAANNQIQRWNLSIYWRIFCTLLKIGACSLISANHDCHVISVCRRLDASKHDHIIVTTIQLDWRSSSKRTCPSCEPSLLTTLHGVYRWRTYSGNVCTVALRVISSSASLLFPSDHRPAPTLISGRSIPPPTGQCNSRRGQRCSGPSGRCGRSLRQGGGSHTPSPSRSCTRPRQESRGRSSRRRRCCSQRHPWRPSFSRCIACTPLDRLSFWRKRPSAPGGTCLAPVAQGLAPGGSTLAPSCECSLLCGCQTHVFERTRRTWTGQGGTAQGAGGCSCAPARRCMRPPPVSPCRSARCTQSQSSMEVSCCCQALDW